MVTIPAAIRLVVKHPIYLYNTMDCTFDGRGLEDY